MTSFNPDEWTLVYMDKDYQVKKVEIYIDLISRWIDIPLSYSSSKLWDRCQDFASAQPEQGPDAMDLAKEAKEAALGC